MVDKYLKFFATTVFYADFVEQFIDDLMIIRLERKI